MRCPLCHADGEPYFRDSRRYQRCPRCSLIYVFDSDRLDAAAERARYALHQNERDDPGYRRFLSRILLPVLDEVPSGAEGLDFGCGPVPVLAEMLREAGRPTHAYDPFFAPDAEVWNRRYDFIAASEVFEHLFHPADELDQLLSALKPSGLLAIMTAFAPPSVEAFATWHYARDPTHVCFYSQQVFEHIAASRGVTLRFAAQDVALLRTR